MKVFNFHGRVLPERAGVTCPSMSSHLAMPWLTGRVDLAIQDGTVFVSVQTEDGDLDLYTLKNSFEQMVQTVVDAANLERGHAYQAVIDSCFTDGTFTVFGARFDPFSGEDISDEIPDAEKVRNLALGDPFLQTALREAAEAMRRANDSPFHARRACEAAMQFVAQHETDRRKGWDLLCENVKIDQGLMKLLGVAAGPIRHADPGSMEEWEAAQGYAVSPDDRLRQIRTARVVVARLFSFAANGRVALDRPMLT